jgi:peptidoglycan/LPS O-acetylase OafA/YrhL
MPPENPRLTLPRKAAHISKHLLELLRPALLTPNPGPRKELSPTAYLDGLRGFAAFLVYLQHHQGWARASLDKDILDTAFGHEGHYAFASFPFIRLFFTGGHIAVSIFFVISGSVLSSKPLLLIHSQSYKPLSENLSSALFRRWIRLFLPAAATTLAYALSWHLFGIWTILPKHQETWIQEVGAWYDDFKAFSFVLRTGEVMYTKYNFHLWSIAVEMRGSIIIFTSLLAFSRCRRDTRLLCEMGLVFYLAFVADACLYAMFVSGMLLCDLDTLARNGDLPAFFDVLRPFQTFGFYMLFVAGVYLAGVPSIDFQVDVQLLKDSPGWNWLAHLKPALVSEADYKWFYLFFAAFFIMASIPRIPWLKRFFETRFNQYLGRISFSLYLVHGPILWTLADRLYLAVGWPRTVNIEGVRDWIGIWPLPKFGPLGLEVAFLVPQLVILPITLWLAEVVTKLFDRPSMKFARWAYGMVLKQDLK